MVGEIASAFFFKDLDVSCLTRDPWKKPDVLGLHDYGREGLDTVAARNQWSFEDSKKGAQTRSRLTGKFWETLHIDLRMVDTSDFIVAYCPTNVYSVGTPHEIALCRQQRKPVLFVSPPVEFPTLELLRDHLNEDEVGTKLLRALQAEVPIKPNAAGIPSLWYMPLVGGESFFDGFGFEPYRKRFGWPKSPLDRRELARAPQRPLLPFLESLSKKLPQKWDAKYKRYTRNDDWLLWDLQPKRDGAEVTSPSK